MGQLSNPDPRLQGEVGNEASSRAGSVGDGGPKREERSYCPNWSDSCEAAGFTVHSPAPALPLSASPKFSRPHLSCFSWVVMCLSGPESDFPSIVPLRKTSTWCGWQFKHICFCVICSECKYQSSNFTVVCDKLKHHQLFFS